MTEKQCMLCYGQEWFHHSHGTFKPFRHGKDTEGFICAYCTRVLAGLAGEALKEAHRKAVERNRTALASILETMMEEENVPKTNNPRCSVAGRRALRKTRAPRGNVRAK